MTASGAPPVDFGANTYSYIQRGTALDAVRALSDTFGVFELMAYPGCLWPAELDAAARREIRARLADAGVRVVALNTPNVDLNLADPPPEMRAHTLRILGGIVELAGDLGVPAVVIGPGKANPLFPEPRARLEENLASSLDVLHPLARDEGVKLLLENMPFAFLPLAAEVMGFLDRYGAADMAALYDAANAYFAGEDPSEALLTMAPKLAYVHLSDTGLAPYRHDPVGTGSVPFEAVAETYRNLGRPLDVVLEIISRDPDRDLRESVRRLRERGW